jgi:large subunit ribosomal protein L18
MPDKVEQKKLTRLRRHSHFMKKFKKADPKLRLVVFRSNKHIYAQIVDDLEQKTITGTSSLAKAVLDEAAKAKGKKEKAKLVGKHIAQLAKEKSITTVVFDRAGYLYHGRIKALAEGAREGGLKF